MRITGGSDMFRGLFKKIDQLITGRGRIDDELFDELEEMLIQADVSVHTTMRIVEDLRAAAAARRGTTGEDGRQALPGQPARSPRARGRALPWSGAPPPA